VRSNSSSAPRRTTPAASAADLALARWENEGGRPAPRSDPPPVRLGRVYDERTAEDGARVLVDRLWPRGLSRSRADLDEWCKQIAPSAALRRWYGHDPDRFDEFGRRYRAELADPGRAEALGHLRALAQQRTLTLLTATRRVEASEAAVLAELLGAGGRPG
jgi:uncharacterized protein YeaO (DUF488 family)